VVAERDHVGACGEDPRGELGRDPDAVRSVLAVDDAERDAELLLQPREEIVESAPSRRADDIPDEEDFQRTESSAAGRTETDTLLPRSCV
jgi:hypothetical protein